MQLVRLILEYAVCVWNPHMSRDIELMEKVQHCATKCIKGLHSKSYDDHWKILDLDSFQRRCLLDLIEVFKILRSINVISYANFLNFVFLNFMS